MPEVFWSQTLPFGGVRCGGLYPERCRCATTGVCTAAGAQRPSTRLQDWHTCPAAEGKASLPAPSPRGGRSLLPGGMAAARPGRVLLERGRGRRGSAPTALAPTLPCVLNKGVLAEVCTVSSVLLEMG